MALLDIEEYIQTKERVLADYEDQDAWMRKTLINIDVYKRQGPRSSAPAARLPPRSAPTIRRVCSTTR